MAEGAVDEEVPDPDEDEHWAEAHALSKGPAEILKKSMPSIACLPCKVTVYWLFSILYADPVMIAAVMMAKVHWKVQKSDVGSVPVTFVITGLFHTGTFSEVSAIVCFLS